MSATPSFSLNLRTPQILGLVAWFWLGGVSAWSQAVPSQANLDASAQRRLQDTMREAQRQRRMEQQVAKLAPALSPEGLSSSSGPVLARHALAALMRLREEGLGPEESFRRAARAAQISFPASAKSRAYLGNLFNENFEKISPSVLQRLEAGEDPAPTLVIPPFAP